MTEVELTIYKIVAGFAKDKTIEDVAKATAFEDLGLDSVALIAILDETEEALGIKFPQDPDALITLPEFIKLVEQLVAAKPDA
jgi:acyl carrier protein